MSRLLTIHRCLFAAAAFTMVYAACGGLAFGDWFGDEGALESCPTCLPDDCDRCRGPATLLTWSCCRYDEEPEDEEDTIVTDRPDFTEASSTVGLGRVQLELGYTYIVDRDQPHDNTAHSFPETLLRVGMFRDWFELRLAYNHMAETANVLGVRTPFTGAEDLYVGAKLALTKQCGWLPEMALVPQANLPTGHDRFTAGEITPGLNWLYGWDITDRLSFAGSTQANRAQDDLGHFYTELAQSLTIGIGLTERLGWYTEWFALFPHSSIDPAVKPQHFLNGGFTYLVTNDVQFDIRAGVGLNGAADDFFGGTGLSVRF